MQERKWERNQRSVTMYVTKAEYQLINSKAELFDVSASKFTKQAVTTYIKHLEKYLKMLNLLRRKVCRHYYHSF